MKICTCDSCHYIFMYPLLPLSCPDCGKDAVGPGTVEEVKEYWKSQEIIEEEIRIGLIKSVGSILDKKEKDASFHSNHRTINHEFSPSSRNL